MTSLHSNRQGTARARGPSLRHKRGVDFSQVRRLSGSTGLSRQSAGNVCPESKTSDQATPQGQASRASRSHSPELLTKVANGTHPKAKGAPTPAVKASDAMFKEELRHFSNNIAKDCDEAFKSSLAEGDSTTDSLTDSDRRQRDSPFTFSLETTPDVAPVAEAFSAKPWDSRPLPPLPSDKTLPKLTQSIAPSIYDADDEKAVEQVARLAVPVMFPKRADRRIVSAPAQTHHSKKPIVMPPINEDKAVNVVSCDKARIVSAPPHTPPRETSSQARGMEYLSAIQDTIRVVHSPTDPGPVKIPKPLNVRKKPMAADACSAGYIAEAHGGCQKFPSRDSLGNMKKKKSWFTRPSKANTDSGISGTDSQGQATLVGSETGLESDTKSMCAAAARKKNFSLPFWKNNKGNGLKMSIDGEFKLEHKWARPLTWTDGPGISNGFEVAKRNSSTRNPSWRHSGATDGSRNIEVKQSWLARLFRVKPATSYMCMAISRKRARQEVAILLREWRRYGIRGVQVDKERNIIFARVGAKNCEWCLAWAGSLPVANVMTDLNLKEVSFAAEIMTVIEHGKRQALSIVRFTQERGAASSFHRVVDTMRTVFDSRHLLVADRSKQKMMIKTLNA